MFSSITLEVSLKPFRDVTPEGIRAVAERIFTQWRSLCYGRRSVGIMLWTADGSEILDYTGELDKPFEWCKFIGSANPPPTYPGDPHRVSLHAKSILYTEDPPVMTYRILREIVSALKDAGRRILGEDTEILVGETFDIGPEFAISDFKYHRHPEIIKGMAMNAKCFINSYGILDADDYPYAGYPNGVPAGTHFGAFLGRQCKHFLPDMGFDFLWLSNGVGFSADPWVSTGVIFDGKRFDPSALAHVKEEVFGFWKQFRSECPDIPIRTRGTNFSAGIDYATDAVPLYDIYNADLDMLVPPNSPWAALDSNFGLELMGQLNRTCHLPKNKRYLFRYYIHDPWWANSPWYDRYEGKPHDIYLPMALSRIDEDGATQMPTDFHILSIDNCWGDLPDSCVNEPLPHILKAEKDAPDAPAPLVWAYPLREFTTATEEGELAKAFANDWFIAEAINAGLPLASAVTNDNLLRHDLAIYADSILLAPIPRAGSEIERYLLERAALGGKTLLYGSLDGASEALLSALGLSLSDEVLTGELRLDPLPSLDRTEDGRAPLTLRIHALESLGGVNTVMAEDVGDMKPLITSGKHVLAVLNGKLAWYRASASQCYKTKHKYLVPDDPTVYAISERLIRIPLASLGLTVSFASPSRSERLGTVMLHRSDNGFFYSCYTPSTAVETRLKLPDGAPLLIGYEAILKGGLATYRLPRAEHAECRVMVSGMDSGVVSCREVLSGSQYYRRRLSVTGLRDAEVVIYPERYCIGDLKVTLNDSYPFVTKTDLDGEWDGACLRLHHVSGTLDIHMPKNKPGRRQMPSELSDRY